MAQEASKASEAVTKKITSEFQRSAARNQEVAGIASNFGAYGFANRVGRVSSMAAGAQAAGFGGAASLLQRAAIPLGVAGGIANAAQSAANILHDRYSTAEQSGRAFVRDFIPGGERAQKFVDALSGRAAGMEQAQIDAQYRSAGGQARNERLQLGLSLNPRMAAAQAVSDTYRKQSAIAPGIYDRTTSEGERQYREEQRILPLKQAEAKAEREAASASKERMSYQKELVSITDRTNTLTKERGRLLAELNKDENQSGVSRMNVLKNIETVNNELEGARGLKRSATESVIGATQREAGAGGELAKARMRTQLLGQAETLAGRVETANEAGSRLGGMNVYDRQFGLYAAKLVKERGSTDGLPDEIIQAAQNFAPQAIGSIVRKTGQGSAEFAEGFKEFGAADFGTTDAAGDSKKEQELRRQLAEGEFKIDKDVSANIVKSFENAGRDFAAIIDEGLQKMKVEILNVVRQGRTAS